MKAMALFGQEDIRSMNFEIGKPQGNDLIIRIIACGVCGSDIRMFFKGPTPRYKLPIVLGHEISGEIVEIGPKVTGYSVGDFVTIAPIIPCMHCKACLRGDDHLCESGEVIGCTVNGGFAELMYIPEKMVVAGGVVKMPKGVDAVELTLAETLACCLHGIGLIPFSIGHRVLIIGDGPIGLSFLQLVKMMGASFVATSGRRSSRKKLAEKLGANIAIDAKTMDLSKAIDQPVDLVIIANSDTETIKEAFQLTRPGGDILLFSGYPYGTRIEVDPNIIHYHELQIHGSIDATIRDFAKSVELFPQLRMRELINESFPLEGITEAFNYAKSGEVVKVVVAP